MFDTWELHDWIILAVVTISFIILCVYIHEKDKNNPYFAKPANGFIVSPNSWPDEPSPDKYEMNSQYSTSY